MKEQYTLNTWNKRRQNLLQLLPIDHQLSIAIPDVRSRVHALLSKSFWLSYIDREDRPNDL